jgi:hypothetical protein
MADLGETARNNENDNSLEQQVLDIMTAVHEAVAAGLASEEYLEVQNQALSALLEGKRITAVALPGASRRPFGYHDSASRWVPRDDQDVVSVSGNFHSAYVQAGRINLFRDEDDDRIPARVESPDYDGDETLWDVTIVNMENRESPELVTEIKIDDQQE